MRLLDRHAPFSGAIAYATKADKARRRVMVHHGTCADCGEGPGRLHPVGGGGIPRRLICGACFAAPRPAPLGTLTGGR